MNAVNFNRSVNARRNIVFAFLNRSINILVPFIVRTVMIQVLGIEYLGLDSLFVSILQILNLAELGIGEAIIFSIYKPIVDNDKNKICALLFLYKKIYIIIGFIILIVGLIILPFVHCFIHGNIPNDINIQILFLIYLFNTVFTYWFFAYKACLIRAFQRSDIISKIETKSKCLLYILQLIGLCLFKSYYMYIIVLPLTTVIYNLFINNYYESNFGDYKISGNVDKKTKNELKYNVIGSAVGKICITTRNALDSIFISAYIGLAVTALYANYYYVIQALTVAVSILITSLTAIVGNCIAVKTITENYYDMIKLNFVYMWICSCLSISLYSLLQDFIFIWLGDKCLLDSEMVLAMVFYFYVMKMGDVRSLYFIGSGLYWHQRYISIGEILCNLVLNVLLINILGLLGVVLATIIALLIFNFAFGTQIVFKYYFRNIKMKQYYLQHLIYMSFSLCSGIVISKIADYIQVDSLFSFVGKCIVCFILSNFLWMIVFRNTQIYKESILWMMIKLKKEKWVKYFFVS